jgi:3-deoxy-alpha-D-manno-octulosonate 8-oxidase
MHSAENREKLMGVFPGGSAIGNQMSEWCTHSPPVMVLHTHHCVANCIVMNVMDEFYPHETEEFRHMVAVNGIQIPRGLCRNLSEGEYRALYDATTIHVKPLTNALGEGFRDLLTLDRVVEIFQRM